MAPRRVRKATSTVLLRNIPRQVPEAAMREICEHHDAVAVRFIPTNASRMRGCVFVTFENVPKAVAFHQLFDGRYLPIDRHGPPNGEGDQNNSSSQTRINSGAGGAARPIRASFALPPQFTEANDLVAEEEGIAPDAGVGYAPNPNLEYSYPPVSEVVLNNIKNALIAVPKFYTQVLHLMNKMNIPPPFDGITQPVPLPAPKKRKRNEDDLLSSDESELQSDDDGQHQKQRNRRKELQRNAPPHSLSTAQPPPPPACPVEVPLQEMKDVEKHCITPEELLNGRMDASAVSVLFPKYSAGEPNKVLYIKNLNHRQIEVSDLEFIYGRYVDQLSQLEIKLMKDGRMKGQSFITFPTQETAVQALHETHGFVIHDKPMVVQYGKSR